MKEYSAKKVDLAVSLILLDGTKKELPGPVNLSAGVAVKIVDKWTEYETKNNRKAELKQAYQSQIDKLYEEGKLEEADQLIKIMDKIHIDTPPAVLANELSMIYNEPTEFFLENLDVGTLGQLLKDVAEELVRLKKEGES